MRNGWILAALVVLGWAGVAPSAFSQERPSISVPDWAKFPSDVVPLADFYPDAAAKAGLGGTATVRCHLATDGELERCVLLSESGSAFGKAAVAAANLITVSAAPPSAKPDGNHVDVPFAFHWPDGMTASQAPDDPRMVTEPNWKHRPSQDDMVKSYPAAAIEKGVSGRVILVCIVTTQGLMDRCRVLSEHPKGVGFGAYALHLTQFFTMTPRMLDDVPTTGQVEIPFNFEGSGAPMPTSTLGPIVKVVSTAIWSETPTAAQVAAAAPKTPDGKAKSGHVMLRCQFAPDGTLRRGCEVFAELPASQGFGSAARSLERYFKADASLYQKADLASYSVDIPINFPGDGTPAATEITDPLWTRTLDPSSFQAIYPPKAVAANITSGRGTVSCTVTHAGALMNCQIIHEEPAGFGFGEAATRVAEVMALNPWTRQGNPVDGDNIRLPLVFKLPPEEAPKAGAPVPATKPTTP